MNPVDEAARVAVLALREAQEALCDVGVALDALGEASGDAEARELFGVAGDELHGGVVRAVDAVALVLGRQAMAALMAPEMAADEAARGPRDVRDRMTAAEAQAVRDADPSPPRS